MTDDDEKTRSSDSDEEVIEEARERYDEAVDAWAENHEQARDDIKFRNGDQWPDEVKEARAGRPMMTFNMMETYISQVIGVARQNRFAIECLPVDTAFEEHRVDERFRGMVGQKDYRLAQVYESLIRQIEYQSRAEDAYDTALDHAAGSGFGFWRVVTQYADDGGFDKEIRILRVANPLSVLIDMADPGFCGEGARYGFVSKWMDRKAYEKEHKEKATSESEFTHQGVSRERFWTTGMVRLCEYFRKIQSVRKYVRLHNHEVLDLGDDKKLWADHIAFIQAHGGQILEERDADCTKVEWRLIDGCKVLEGPVEFPSKHIPLVMVPGRELNQDGEVIYRSLIRFAKDAQRKYNYDKNSAAERKALGTRAPWTGPDDLFEGFENIWRNANTENLAYLPWNSKADSAKRGLKPDRVSPPDFEHADARDAEMAEMDIKLTTGIFQAGLGQNGPEVSGKALNIKKNTSDAGTFSFHDNLAKAVAHTGRILIDMIPRVYDSERVIRIRGVNGDTDAVMVNRTDPMTGRKYFDLGAGKFDLVVRAGGNYISQRQEFVEVMAQILQGDRELMRVIGDKFFANMDFPGADEIARRLKALLPPEVKAADKAGEAEANGEPGQEAPETFTGPQVQQMIAQAIEKAKQEGELAVQQGELQIRGAEAQVKKYDAQTKRMQAVAGIQTDQAQLRNEVIQMLYELLNGGGGPPPGPGRAPMPAPPGTM